MNLISVKPFILGQISNPLSLSECDAIKNDMLFWYESKCQLFVSGNGKLKIDTKLDKNLFDKFIDQSSEITRLALGRLTSKYFLKKLAIRFSLLVILGRLDLRSLDILKAIFGLGTAKIRVELSWLPIGSFIVPHTDSYAKLFSGLIYLPQDNDEHLGTIFWNSKIKNEENLHYHGDLMTEFNKSKNELFKPSFENKSLYFFIRNQYSWHGMEEISHQRKDYVRLSINVNIISERDLPKKK